MYPQWQCQLERPFQRIAAPFRRLLSRHKAGSHQNPVKSRWRCGHRHEARDLAAAAAVAVKKRNRMNQAALQISTGHPRRWPHQTSGQEGQELPPLPPPLRGALGPRRRGPPHYRLQGHRPALPGPSLRQPPRPHQLPQAPNRQPLTANRSTGRRPPSSNRRVQPHPQRLCCPRAPRPQELTTLHTLEHFMRSLASVTGMGGVGYPLLHTASHFPVIMIMMCGSLC